MSSLATLFLTTDEDGLIIERIFGLDDQFLMDAFILGLAVFVLFVILSYLVFNPARDLLRRRQENPGKFGFRRERESRRRKAQNGI